MFIPFAALALQWTLWTYIKPFVWFFFFPAVFCSAWVGGFRAGIIGTIEADLIVIFFFIEPRLSFRVAHPENLLSVAVFSIMGYLFSLLQDRLSKATSAARSALAASEEAKAEVTRLYEIAKESEELKTRFFANVSHELRTPLTLVLGSVRRVARFPDTGLESLRELEVAERNALHIYRHVNDLLDIAKLEAREMGLNLEAADASAIVREIASYYMAEAEARGIEIVLSLPTSLELALDREKYRRIVENLLSNAMKFSASGGRIEISLGIDGGEALLAVQDEGAGIPEGMREAVFERFKQVEGYDRRRHGGTGLGLSIVKAFAELHGGRAWAESSPAGGAKLSVALPIRAPGSSAPPISEGLGLNDDEGLKESLLALEEDRSRCSEGEILGPEGAPLVLVVEDNVDINNFVASVLAIRYRVARAYDGAQGSRMARAMKLDAIVTDLMMPIADGEDLIKEIRSHSELDGVPIIVLSALEDEELRVRLLRGGAQDYMVKPFSEAELLARVERLVAERRSAADTLREAEERYKLLAENAVDVIWILEVSTGRFKYISPSVERLRGWSAEEVLSQGIAEALSPASAEHLRAVLPERIEAFRRGDDAAYVDEIEQPLKSGGSVWTETTTKFRIDERTGGFEVYGISRDISERRKSEARIRKDVQEREALIRELYHRTGNNMGVISSLLELEGSQLADSRAQAAFEAVCRKIDAMALAHRMLYEGEDLSTLELGGYAERLARQVLGDRASPHGGIVLELGLDRIPALIDLAVPFGLILCELIQNSLRHAFAGRNAGRVAISLARGLGDKIELRYADDGEGPAPGFAPRTQGGLGLQTIFMLGEQQLQGLAEFSVAPGFPFRLEFGGTAYKERV